MREGKFDFDHNFAFPEKIELFAWWHLFWVVERIISEKLPGLSVQIL